MLSMSIPANPAPTGIQNWLRGIIPPTAATAAIAEAGCQACDASGNRDAAVGACRDAFQVVINRASAPRDCPISLATVSVAASARAASAATSQTRFPVALKTTEPSGSHCEIGQNLPRIAAFPALGKPERQLAAVSQAGGCPGHHKQRCERGESGWAGAGKKQETGETARQRPGSIDAAQGASQHREAQRHGGGDGQPLRG